MRVIRVIPETGLVPTVAIARAATVVNRNEMMINTPRAISDSVLARASPPSSRSGRTPGAERHSDEAAGDQAIGMSRSCARARRRGGRLAAEQLREAHPERLHDHPPTAQMPMIRPRDGADADVAHVVAEDLLGVIALISEPSR